MRGDDAYWGLRHTSGKSIAMNGIGVWHADFDHKNGPPSAFYENRNVPIIAALAYPDHTAHELRRRVVDFTLRSIFSFRYDWAQAILDGVEAFLDGPEALMAADPAALHAEIRKRYRTEELRPMTEAEMELPDIRASSRLAALVMRPIAMATLGGNLLPKFVRRADPVVIYLQHRSVMAGVLRDELLYRFMPTAEGFTARRDRRRAFALLRRTSRVARRIMRGARPGRCRLPGCRAGDDLSGVLGAQVRRSGGALNGAARTRRRRCGVNQSGVAPFSPRVSGRSPPSS